MAEHVWSVLCDFGVVDVQSNKISLINSLEQVKILASDQDLRQELENAKRTQETPILPIVFQKVSYWVRTDLDVPESVTSRVLLSLPNGEHKLGLPEKIDLTTHFGFRSRITMQGVHYGGIGVYWFNVCVGTGKIDSKRLDDWLVVARLPLLVQEEGVDGESPAGGSEAVLRL
jgi:hypothetical protein